MFPKVFLILSESDDDVVCFSVLPAIIVLSVGDLLVAAILVPPAIIVLSVGDLLVAAISVQDASSQHFQVIEKLVYRFIFSLPPFLEAHHRLVALHP